MVGSIRARAVLILVEHDPRSDQRNRESSKDKRQNRGYESEDCSRQPLSVHNYLPIAGLPEGQGPRAERDQAVASS